MTRRHWQPVAPGQALVQWEMAEPEETLYPGLPRPMPDRVTYRFANGWVDTGDLPCREALRASLPSRVVERPTGPFPRLHSGFDGPEMDFSCFRFRPTLVVHALRCRLRVAASGIARLRLDTCGGVRLWLGSTEVAAFEPFTRNRPQSIEVSVNLPIGDHDLTLRTEDLHERDTTCFAAVRYLEGPALEVSAGAAAASPEVAALVATLGSLRSDAIYREAGTVHLMADPPPDRPVSLTVTDLMPMRRGGMTGDPAAGRRRDIVLSPTQQSAPICNAEDGPVGCLAVDVTASADGVEMTRRLGVTVLPPATPLPGDLSARKRAAVERILASDGFEPTVAALLASHDRDPDRVAAILDIALTHIEERHDCSDFTILPLLRLWADARGRLAPALRTRLQAALLGYRYWLDAPGDDVMWFWSENHVLCFHTAQWVAGNLFPDATFLSDGRTGSQHRASAEQRLHRWFASIAEHGLCEWNSAAYYPIDLLGLLTLHDMAPPFQTDAAAIMDRIFTMTGLHCSGGVPAGSQGRCYEKELLAGPATELGSVASIAFGGGYYRPGYDRAAGLFCLSDYAPPDQAAALAHPAPGTRITARYTQGLDHAGKLTLWKTAAGQLSTVSELPAGTRGHQAQVLDVQLSDHPMARLWINHPGDRKVWGDRRPSLLAGNHVMPQVAQHGATALMIYDTDRPWTDLHLTQLFAAAEAFDSIGPVGDWTVFSAAEGAAAVWCSRPLKPVTGLYAGALHRAHGARTGWVVTLRDPDENAESFRARLAATAPRFEPDTLTLQTTDNDGTPLALTFDGRFHINGGLRPFAPLSPEPEIDWTGPGTPATRSTP